MLSGKCPECSVSIQASLEYSNTFPDHRARDLFRGLQCHVTAAVVFVPSVIVTLALSAQPLVMVLGIPTVLIFTAGTCSLAGLLSESRTRKQSVFLALIVVSTLSLLFLPVALVRYQSYMLAAALLAMAIPGTVLQIFLIMVAHLQIPALLNPESQREPQGTFPMATGALNFLVVLPGLCLATMAFLGGGWVAPLGVVVLLVVLAFLSIWILWLGFQSAVLSGRMKHHRGKIKKRARAKT